MGGVKNRDAKRAAAKVFSSGGGGGSKGPSVVDKRGQEEKCPHCDRVFKQNNRLKEHIAKQHAEQEQPPAPPAAAPQQLAGSSSASRPSAPGEHKAGNLSVITAATAAANSCSSSRPGASSSSSHYGSAKTSDTGGPAGGSSSSSSQTYDVGSRAGFYTEKSPKLILHEWCTQQKRPKPRYKAVPVDADKGGGFRARIVLPDSRLPGTDKDVIIWLDAEHAADHEEEALQRAAVAALQAVAGDRSLDYILPQRYRPLWKDINNKAAERAEAQRRAAAAAAERKTRAARSQNPARAPVSVVMSDKQREAVEGLMQELTTSNGNGDSDSSAVAAVGLVGGEVEIDAEVRQGLVDSLIKSGFSAADSAAAVKAIGTAAGEAAAAAASAAIAAASAGGRGYTRVWRSCDGLQPYLDWLCLNLPVERLPARYRPGGSSGTVGVLRVNNPSSSRNSLPSAGMQAGSAGAAGAAIADSDGIPGWQQDPHVQQLVTYGYPPDHVMHALQSCGGSLLTALHYLQQQLLAGSSTMDPTDPGAFGPAVAAESDAGSSELPQAWLDEVEVLTAIYGDDLRADAAGMLTLAQDAGDQVGGYGCLQLIVWCPMQPKQYPDAAPLIAVQCSQMPASQLLQLTVSLAATARQYLGNPVIHELAVQLMEELQVATATPSTDLDALPAPFDQPPPNCQQASAVAVAEEDAGPDGYTEAAEQHAAAAEAMLEGSSINRVSSSKFSGQKRQRRHTGLSVEQAAHESKRLKEHYTRLQTDRNYAAMKASRARLPAFSCREEVLSCVSGNDVVVISGATGCGKSTQVPQYIFEQAVATGAGGSINIIVCQPRRIAAVGLATRVADEVGDAAGVGGLVGYSVRLDTKSSHYTRLLFCTTGVLLRRLMSDPYLEGVTHVILDEVHERNLDSDLLLLLLRRTLLAASKASSGAPPPPKVLLMSATADAQLFVDYFANADSQALLLGADGRVPTAATAAAAGAASATNGKTKQQQQEPRLSVGNMSIPGFTHPVRQLWLEDVLQATGISIGKQSRYAKQKRPKFNSFDQSGDEDLNSELLDWSNLETESCSPTHKNTLKQQAAAQHQRRPCEPMAAGATMMADKQADIGGHVLESSGFHRDYSPEVIKSLQLVDPAIINYELIEELLVHVLSIQKRHGPSQLLQGLASDARKTIQAGGVTENTPGAVLIFMPGAPEIDKLVRQLQASRKLLDSAGRGLRILPLHGGLPSSVQSRVFERPPRGVFKVVVATNVAETSLTIDDVTVVIDTGRHKEMSYDHTRGLSCLTETWVSQAAAQQRRGRAGRVAPGTCYRLWPSFMWKRLAPHQPPEVLRVPLQQLCLTTKAALAATATGVCDAHIAEALSSLLTPPSLDFVQQALLQLNQLGALLQSPKEILTPLGAHLAAMPMDAALGKALLYGCMLRCASPLLTIAAALGHGRSLWLSPSLDKRAEIATLRQALAPQAYVQRSDHLAIVATYNGWLSAKAVGGKGAGSEFARTYCVSEQALEAVSKGRLDLAIVLQQRGFLPEWYFEHLKQVQRSGMWPDQPQDASTPDAEVYGVLAVATGAPDEYSHNARIVKAAICAGFYPRILRVEAPIKYQQVQGGAMRVEANPSNVKFFERTLGRVWMHPASVCFPAGSYPSGWVVYTQLVETSRPFIREASMVPVYALLAFGGHLEVLHDQGLLLLDGWASFRAPARVGVLIKHLRHAVSQLFVNKLNNPLMELSSQRVVEALHQLLASDGF